MYFINSARTAIKLYSYNNSLRMIAWKETPRIEHGAGFDQHQAEHSVELSVFADRPGFFKPIGDSRWKVTNFHYADNIQHNQGPVSYLNTTNVVITHRDDYRFVDWNAAIAPYVEEAKALGAENAPNEAADAALTTAVALLSAMSTGFSAMGPGGALPAGMASMILSLIGSTQTPPPPPPDAAAIEKIVTTVVRRERNIQDAEKAATAFATTSQELLNFCKQSFDRLINPNGTKSGKTLTDHERTDIEHFIENSMMLAGEGTLLFSISHMARHPEMAMWILPTYLQGISAYLMLLRIHKVWASEGVQSDGKVTSSISLGDIKAYCDEVTAQKVALQAAYDAFNVYLKTKISATHLDESTMENSLTKIICRSMFGVDNMGAIKESLKKLGELETQLGGIINSGDVRKFVPTVI